jgi:sugar phosphate permease
MNFDLMSHMLTVMSLFFVTAGLQFWTTDYLYEVMGLSQLSAFKSYIFVATLPPILGVVLAGIVFDRIGGYTGPRTLPICFTFGLVAMVCGMAVPFLENIYLVGLAFSFELLGGGFAMPAMTGAMLN